MILSIGMIVKNEEKYLRMCLEALKPLLDELNSELIIADTGSTDGTVETAKEFTDKVYHFEWCNDYSKARNFTLEKSSGEWFMFIDADEILQNPQNIIRFFKTGKYKKYSWAMCIQRNLNNEEDMSSYSDYAVARMCDRKRNMRFCGIIHEALSPLDDKYFNTDAVFLHYGYISGKAFVKKAKRYAESIKTELKENPDDMRLYLLLTDAYSNFDLYKAIETARYATEKCRDGKYINLLYNSFIKCLFKAKNYTELFEAAEKYFSLTDKPRVTDINITDTLISAYYGTDRYAELIGVYKKYEHTRNLVLNKKLTSIEQGSMSLDISEFYLVQNMIMLLSAYTRLGNYAEGISVLDKIYKYPKALGNSNIRNLAFAVFELYDKSRSREMLKGFTDFADANDYLADVASVINMYTENRVYFNDHMYDVLEMMHCRAKTGASGIFYKLLLCGKHEELIHDDDIYVRAENAAEYIPDILYLLLKYGDISKAEKCIKNKEAYIRDVHFDDMISVIYDNLKKTNDPDMIIPLCEQLFVLHDHINAEDMEYIKNIYCKTLRERPPFPISDEINIENSYLLEPLTRFRYLCGMLDTDKEACEYIKKINLPLNVFGKEGTG
ncbi:MAG: glycosyltransferase family 2 protein [Oscillospiraceae bacterium]|nr:glycosyltransferase family 2 protein [Oscillospiraceae bacterium]